MGAAPWVAMERPGAQAARSRSVRPGASRRPGGQAADQPADHENDDGREQQSEETGEEHARSVSERGGTGNRRGPGIPASRRRGGRAVRAIRAYNRATRAFQGEARGHVRRGGGRERDGPLVFEMRDLAKTYADGKEAVRGLSLTIRDGMFGLLGPNGAGKTTFLSMLVLACEPTRGERIYDGLDAARPANRPPIRRMIGYLPQDFAVIPHLSGIEYLEHCARLRRVPLRGPELRRRALDLLDAVDLTQAAFRRASEYSGGMRRRLGIAQALIHAPRLLVVDEPTAGLDPGERINFRNLIAEIAEGTAVLLSTHIVEDVEATCSRLAIIGDGALLFDATPSDLLYAANRKLWDLPAAAGLPPGAVAIARRLTPAGELRAVVHSQAAPAGGTPREPTLEEAYSAFLAVRGLAAGEEEA